MKNEIKDSYGFTIIEALIAITILLITSIAGAYFLVSSQQFVTNFEEDLKGGNFAADTLDYYAWLDLSEWNEGDGQDGLPEDFDGTRKYNVRESQDGNYRIFVVTVTIND